MIINSVSFPSGLQLYLHMQIVRVPSDFAAEEGLRLTDDLVVGKMLGGGVQGAVYLLNNPDGKDSGQLLKVRLVCILQNCRNKDASQMNSCLLEKSRVG